MDSTVKCIMIDLIIISHNTEVLNFFKVFKSLTEGHGVEAAAAYLYAFLFFSFVFFLTSCGAGLCGASELLE